MKRIRLPNRIKTDGFTLQRLLPKRDSALFEQLVEIYNNNIEHLIYWHRNINALLFKTGNDYITYLKQGNLMCYAVIISGKVTGCIEVGYISKDYEKLKYRVLTYWIDKNFTRKHIISKTVNIFENYFNMQNLDYISADICANNIASKTFLEKNNFLELYRYNSFFYPFEGGYASYKKNLSARCVNSDNTVNVSEKEAA